MHSSNPTSSASQTVIAFTSGAYRLRGILHRPAGSGPFPVVIGCHGLLATADSPKQITLAERLSSLGLAYFRFDHRGCGRSEGDLHAATRFAGRREDLMQAAGMLLERSDLCLPMGLFGSSYGGAVCLAAAADLAPAAMVTLAAPFTSTGIAPAAVADLIATEPSPGVLDQEALKFDLSVAVPTVSHLLVIHGSADAVVPFDNAVRIHSAAQRPKQLLELPGGDHRVSDPIHQRRFLEAAAHWLASMAS